MGWSSEVPNKYTEEFIRFAATCSAPVLDIGAAFGVATIRALVGGAEVFANDIDGAHLENLHSRVTEGQSRLTLVQGRFPNEFDFPPDFFDAVHVSNVLHFIRGEELLFGVAKIMQWLRPNGKLFIMTGTPFVANFKKFIPVFLERKHLGVRWPGEIENVREYNDHYTVALIPDFIHFMDEDILLPVLREAGLVIEKAEKFSRANLPDFCVLDGRENLGVVARKPAS